MHYVCKITIYRVYQKKLGLVAFLPIVVIFFFQNVMAANIIENLKNFEIFRLSQGGKKIFFFDFLEIEKTFENKKGVIFEFMVKSQFLFNSIGYFLKKMTKIREPFFADFPQYLPSYWTENREKQSGISFKAILSIGIKLS